MVPDIVIGSVLAATITGVVSLLGLIISKENKTSEFRQAWIDALREEVAQYIANINALHTIGLLESDDYKDLWKIGREDYIAAQSAAATIRLRLNANEIDAQSILEKIDEIEEEFAPPSDPTAGQIKGHERELIEATNLLLKNEWLRVRDGEQTYRIAKIIAIVVLLTGVVVIIFSI